MTARNPRAWERHAASRRELTAAELAVLPQQVVYRSASLRRLTIHGVRMTALLDALFPGLGPRVVTLELLDGSRRRLAAAELDNAVLAYRLDHGPLTAQMGGPFRLLIDDGGQVTSVSSVKRIHLSEELSQAA